VPAALGEHPRPEPVHEHQAHLVRRVEANRFGDASLILTARRTRGLRRTERCAERLGDGRQHGAQARPGVVRRPQVLRECGGHRGVGHARRAVAAESARLNAIAASTAPRPSAAELIRTTTSSCAIVPVIP